MRLLALLTISALTLAACSPPVPESGRDYNSYLREREASAGRAQPIVPPGFSTSEIGAAIDRAAPSAAEASPDPSSQTAAVIGATPVTPVAPSAPVMAAQAPAATNYDPDRPRGGAPSNIKQESGEMIHASPAISDENDFKAVSQRETIASDKERIERNRAQYVVIQPGDLPTRPGDLGPNIVDYALATTNPVGAQLYKRSAFSFGNNLAKCARYASPDLAQEDFLAKGGPEKDRLGLDPDGDGYACAWDPTPFRLR